MCQRTFWGFQEVEKQAGRQKRLEMVGLIAGLLFNTILSGLVLSKVHQAERRRMHQYAATARELAETDEPRSLANSLAAIGLSRSPFVRFPNLTSEDLITFPQQQEAVFLETFGDAQYYLARAEYEGVIDALAFSPDGQTFVSGNRDGTLHLWEKDDAWRPTLIGEPFQVRRGAIYAVAFSPDGQTIVSGSSDGSLRLWDLQGNAIGQPFQGHEGGVLSVAFSPDGQTIVSGGQDGTVRLWNIQGNPIGNPLQGHRFEVAVIAVSPDGKTIASGGYDGLRLWDMQGNPIDLPVQEDGGEGSATNINGSQVEQLLQASRNAVHSLAFSLDGETLISGRANGKLSLWNLRGNPPVQTIRGHEDTVFSVTVMPDRYDIDREYGYRKGTIVSGSRDGTVRLWDMEGNAIGQPFQQHEDMVFAVAASTDGKTIVSSGFDGALRLWPASQVGWLADTCHAIRGYLRFTPQGDEVMSEAQRTCEKQAR
ncbi:MAG: WD40 repeat domain-containing protein [Leptolyngbyaceae cyanobacterium]